MLPIRKCCQAHHKVGWWLRQHMLDLCATMLMLQRFCSELSRAEEHWRYLVGSLWHWEPEDLSQGSALPLLCKKIIQLFCDSIFLLSEGVIVFAMRPVDKKHYTNIQFYFFCLGFWTWEKSHSRWLLCNQFFPGMNKIVVSFLKIIQLPSSCQSQLLFFSPELLAQPLARPGFCQLQHAAPLESEWKEGSKKVAGREGGRE